MKHVSGALERRKTEDGRQLGTGTVFGHLGTYLVVLPTRYLPTRYA